MQNNGCQNFCHATSVTRGKIKKRPECSILTGWLLPCTFYTPSNTVPATASWPDRRGGLDRVRPAAGARAHNAPYAAAPYSAATLTARPTRLQQPIHQPIHHATQAACLPSQLQVVPVRPPASIYYVYVARLESKQPKSPFQPVLPAAALRFHLLFS